MDTSVLNWLDRAAARFGDKTAYEDAEHSLSFCEADRISRSVGAFLQARGAKPGSPVVVMGARYVYTIPCFLGVVRAGCFYAAADAEMPAGRLRPPGNRQRRPYRPQSWNNSKRRPMPEMQKLLKISASDMHMALMWRNPGHRWYPCSGFPVPETADVFPCPQI